jgi:uncharacterized repeat protein (TIGR03803 family)
VDKTLYGASYRGGAANFGSVFKVNTDGTGLTVLKSFSISNQPFAGVCVVNDTVFGTTMGTFDDVNGLGSVFSIKTNGTNYRILRSFAGGDGANPRGTPLVIGNRLYGTTRYGGSSNKGTLFSLVIATPPEFTREISQQSVEAGTDTCLHARVTGTPPLSFHWIHNDTNILGGGTPGEFLCLTNIGYSQAGSYSVVVTNAAGAVTSAPANLGVISPVDRRNVPLITCAGEPSRIFNLEWCDDIQGVSAWQPLTNFTLSVTNEFCFDLTKPLPAARFYRAWQAAPTTITPAIDLDLIPALTLNGAVGSLIRVDGINAIGPTNAWFTIDTVTLTNTSQLFFDISAPGQPRRLYRLVTSP